MPETVMGETGRMRLLCPAKINVHLRVGPRRDDGFHPLLSWMCTVGLFDTLTLDWRPAEPGAGTPQVVLEVEGGSADLPQDERNLVVRIAKTWIAERGLGMHISARLQKRIRVGAGLGGGSSDAARTILALDAITRAGRQRLAGSDDFRAGRVADDLSAFAARFGSDVPFFLSGDSTVCTGRGEVLRPVGRARPGWVLLALPPVMMPTPAVYRSFDEMGLGREADVTEGAGEPDWKHWASLDASALLPRLVNDLEPAAFALRPDLGALREGIERTVGRPVRMSGSGSSLFTLFDVAEEAREAARRVTEVNSVDAHAVQLGPAIHDDLDATL